MKSIFWCLSFLITSMAFAVPEGQLCRPSTPHVEFCRNMKHLGTAINTIESQSFLMRINAPYLNALAIDVAETTDVAGQVFPLEFAKHKQYLDEVKNVALELKAQSAVQDLNMLGTAHQLGRQCLNCHMALPTEEGSTWNDMFGNSWRTINHECHQRGKNPYLCKTMNAIAGNYNHIVTAYTAKRENHQTVVVIAQEILRLLRDLGANRFEHLGVENRLQAESDLLTVIELARTRDHRAFEKARDLNKTCMACHDQVAGVSHQKAPKASIWK